MWKYFGLQFLMLFKRIYVLNDIKIFWFANSYAFEKDVLDKWYENASIKFSYAFQKDVWDKWYENTLICNFICFWKSCLW